MWYCSRGRKVPENELNERLKQLLVAPENAGMVLNTEEASAENIIEVESHNKSYEEDGFYSEWCKLHHGGFGC